MRVRRTPLVVSLRARRADRSLRRVGTLGWVIAVIATLLAACGDHVPSLSSEALEPAARMTSSSRGGAASALAVNSGAEAEASGAQANEPDLARKLIQNAELHLEVESCDVARRAIEADVARAGGYVSSANVNHYEGRVSRAVLVLRLPATSLGSALETYAELGTVLHESLTTQDITEQFFDLEARLGSARKLEARLHELLTTEARELKDLLEVERELARVRETIERFEGKLRLWEQQVAFSTLTVQLATRELFVAAEPRTLREEIGRTISSSWQALVTAGRALVLVVVAILPWILPLLFFGWLTFRLLRRIERGLARRAEARREAYLAQAEGSSEERGVDPSPGVPTGG